MSTNKIELIKKKLTELFIATKLANNPVTTKITPVTPAEPGG